MVIGRVSHHWDLFVPLICYTANPWLDKRHRLTPKKVHPFWKEKPKSGICSRKDWNDLKAALKREVTLVGER